MGNMKANRKFKQEQEAVSAVIGVILMVAITVAIAATVYVYVSGMIGTGTQSTPSISMTSNPIAGAGVCSITIATASSPNILWASAVTLNLNCLTNASKMSAGHVVPPPSGNITGGDLISLNGLAAGSQYSLTLSYKATGGTMGTVTWNQI
jgi:FlaG/FlaF family flagellin (archaellin)